MHLMNTAQTTTKDRVLDFYWRCTARLLPSYLGLLHGALADCQSILEVGCGTRSPLRFFRGSAASVGLDLSPSALAASRSLSIHDAYVYGDALRLPVRPRCVDAVLALDVVEHFDKKDAACFLEGMEAAARKKVIVVTPNGFISQNEYDGNPLQAHLSGWSVGEFRERGYEVRGVSGWKPLRREKSLPRIWPRPFGLVLSDASQPFVVRRPERAFHLFCVKRV